MTMNEVLMHVIYLYVKPTVGSSCSPWEVVAASHCIRDGLILCERQL